MFEKLSDKLDKQTIDRQTESIQINLTALNAMTEQFKDVIKEASKTVRVEHHHKIEIASNWVFLSLMGMGLMILGLSYFIGNQRQTISRYKGNDLKYRYIKMQGQTTEDSIYRLEDKFEYLDSIAIVRKQVEEYERLVREQAERIERAKVNETKAKKLQEEVEKLKKGK
jgi:hypothetical protein